MNKTLQGITHLMLLTMLHFEQYCHFDLLDIHKITRHYKDITIKLKCKSLTRKISISGKYNFNILSHTKR